MLSLSPYFQTSLASSYSILYFVRVGSEMEGISPAFIWSYQAFAILSSAVIDFFSSSSLDIEIHHHLFIIVNTPDFEYSPAFAVIRYGPGSLRGDFCFPDLGELAVHFTDKICFGEGISCIVRRDVIHGYLTIMPGIITQLNCHLSCTGRFLGDQLVHQFSFNRSSIDQRFFYNFAHFFSNLRYDRTDSPRPVFGNLVFVPAGNKEFEVTPEVLQR